MLRLVKILLDYPLLNLSVIISIKANKHFSPLSVVEREHYPVPGQEPHLGPPRDPDGRHRGVPRQEQAGDPRS